MEQLHYSTNYATSKSLIRSLILSGDVKRDPPMAQIFINDRVDSLGCLLKVLTETAAE